MIAVGSQDCGAAADLAGGAGRSVSAGAGGASSDQVRRRARTGTGDRDGGDRARQGCRGDCGGAKKLAAAKDIAAARTAFGEVSTALAAYAEKTKSGFGPDVRLAYCPMANKPWLTKDKAIRNPYYGAAMLTCGSFK